MKRRDRRESELDVVLRQARDSRRRYSASAARGHSLALRPRQKKGTIPIRTAGKRRKTRLVLLTLVISVLLVLGTASWLSNDTVTSPWTPATARFRAALVDELSPNPSFVATTRSLLVNAGYTFDYYGSSQVTLGLYRDLAVKGYGLLILRSHTVKVTVSEGERDIGIVTSEPYSSAGYLYEQLTDQSVAASLAPSPDLKYFAVTPKFVRDQTRGAFPNSTVIMMGCSSIAGLGMSRAFLSKGAALYIGWTEQVAPDYTDSAILVLLRSLVQGETVDQAVNIAMNSVGPNQGYPAQLSYERWTPADAQRGTFSFTGLSVVSALVGLIFLVPATVLLAPKFFSKLRKRSDCRGRRFF